MNPLPSSWAASFRFRPVSPVRTAALDHVSRRSRSEIRHFAELYACCADGGTDQPACDDRGFRNLARQLDQRQLADNSIHQEPPRRDHLGNSLGWIHGHRQSLIQDQTKQAINGLPGLAQVPVLGTLFRSRDFVNNQTELMVIVTPYVVRAVAQKDLSRPDDGFAAAADPQADFLGSVNRIYGVPNRNAQRPYISRNLRLHHRLRWDKDSYNDRAGTQSQT